VFQSWNIAVSTPPEGCSFLNVISQHCQLERLYSTSDEGISTVHWWNDTKRGK
jgi:hypothetical protein